MDHLPRPIHLLRMVLISLLLPFLLVTPVLAGKPGPAPLPRTVCLDAGHGGSDPGAVHHGLQEKEVNLDIAQRLKALLEAANFTVVMTRTGDEELGNTARATICNEGRADTVLSIHLNASTNPSINYFQAFYGKVRKDGDFTQTIWDNYNITKPNRQEPLPKNPPSQFASGLLLKTTAPACLTETVFISNPEEATALKEGSGQRQQQIAEELFKGLQAWYTSQQ